MQLQDLQLQAGLHFFLFFVGKPLWVGSELPVLFPLGAMTSIFSNH